MAKKDAIRFAVGEEGDQYTPVWRAWNNRSDVYLAARSTAGLLKLSLHESGQWMSAFTTQSGVTLEQGGRRQATWHRPNEFAPGWTMGPEIVVPWVEWAGELPFTEQIKYDTFWFPAPEPGQVLTLKLLFSSSNSPDEVRRIVDGEIRLCDEAISLRNREYVWIYGQSSVLDNPGRTHVEELEKQFQTWTFDGPRSEFYGGNGMEIFNGEPRIILFPLGHRHVAFPNDPEQVGTPA